MIWSLMIAGLLVVSVFTSLATEGIKILLKERNKTYHANMLAGIVAVVLSIFAGIAYTVTTGTPWSPQLIIYIICLVFLSWLCAMVGYDKVMQALHQIREVNTDESK